MPLTAKGEKILAAMIEQYGEEKGKRVFYASKNAGRISGVDGMDDALVLEFDDAARATIIDGGYMRAMPKIARTGIQLYHGKECGRPDVEKVRVYRPQDQVFGTDAVKSYTHLPVTLEHPGVAVDSSNWKKFAVGETGDEVLRDGGTVRVPMMLRDAAAIEAVKDGKNQISVGYSCDLEWTDGVTPDGDKYDAVQTNIRGNHVAIVSTARGGPELKFGDKGERTMDLKTITIDGISCQMTDTAVALVQRLQDSFEEFKKKKKKEEEETDGLKRDVASKDAALAVKDKEIADLQVQLKDATSPAKIEQAARDFTAVVDRATKITGKQFKADGMSVTDIRRAVVDAKLGNVAKGWDDNKIEGAFDAFTVTSPGNPIRDAAIVFGRPGGGYTEHASGSADPRDQAYYDSVKELENAWRPKQ